MKNQEVLVSDWNKKHRPGMNVVVTLDDGTQWRTKTRSYAALLGGHTAVIWLEGMNACYSLERVMIE